MPDTFATFVAQKARDEGLSVMAEIIDIVHDREQLSEGVLQSLLSVESLDYLIGREADAKIIRDTNVGEEWPRGV